MPVRRLLAGAALLAAAVAPRHARAQELPLKLAPRPTEPGITSTDLMTRLYLFADDSMGGRATGTEGHLKATAYLAEELARLGLEPAGDDGSYFQPLPLVRRSVEGRSAVWASGRRFTRGEDFGVLLPRGAPVRLPTSAPVIFGGDLADSASWITADEARGRIVVMRPDARRLQLGSRTFSVAPGSRFAQAAAYVVPQWEALAEASRAALGRPSTSLVPPDEAPLPPTLVVSEAMAEAVLGAPLAARQAAPDARARLSIAVRATALQARNVVAVWPGRDSGLRSQYVALGAHSDHDPVLQRPLDHDSVRAAARLRHRPVAERRVDMQALRALRPSRPDSIRNGADDDASGSMALLEIAEALAGATPRPRRSVLFVWHAAEELGLLGADWFSRHPSVPRDSLVALLNLDMVGRGGVDDIAGGGPQYVQLVGARRLSTDLGHLIETVNARRVQPFRFDYALDARGHPENIYCRSDHAMYARHGIPVAFFTTGMHADYHQVTDEPQYIDYEKLAALTQLVHDIVIELADRAARPRVDGPRPDPAAACRQ